MKLFTFLCFVTLTLASSQYYVLRRGIPAKGLGIPSGHARPRVAVKAGDPKKLPKPSADLMTKGPALVYHLDAQGNEIHHRLKSGETALRKSGHPTRPAVGGALGGPPSKDHPLEVNSKGKYAAVSVITPPGGSGYIRIHGDDGPAETRFKGPDSRAGAAHSASGEATAHASVSRGGEAHAIGFHSAENIDPHGDIEKLNMHEGS